ncbi:MAG TPA: LysE family translocator [Pseudonocardiaceae bacterium]|nr:LysE family translocator [Pseudonocardiaceae bacterium]
MVSTGQIIGVGLACVVVLIVPGPSVLFIVGRALSYGRRTALFSIVGNSIGSYLAAVCVSVGLGPFLQRSDLLFQTIKLLGAAYLVWLGVQAIRRGDHVPASDDEPPPIGSPWRAVRTGVLVGVTNPKTFIIFGAILPQFVNLAAGSVPAQMLVLAVVPIVIGLITDTCWGLIAGQARAWLAGTPRRMVALNRIGGLSMIGLGVSVAVTGRHD